MQITLLSPHRAFAVEPIGFGRWAILLLLLSRFFYSALACVTFYRTCGKHSFTSFMPICLFDGLEVERHEGRNPKKEYCTSTEANPDTQMRIIIGATVAVIIIIIVVAVVKALHK